MASADEPYVTVGEGKQVPRSAQSFKCKDGSRTSLLVGEDGEFMTKMFDDVSTCWEAFERGCRISGDNPCMGQRSGPAPELAFEWQTYNEVKTRVVNVASGLVGIGLEGKQHVGMFSRNRSEFQIAQLACFRQSAVLVPLYDTLGPEAIVHILNQAELSIVFVSGDKLQKLFDEVKKADCMKTVIKIDDATEEEVQQATDLGLTLMSMSELEKKGAEEAKDAQLPSPDDIAVVCYTSGTTGNPKGVLLTHGNIVCDVTGACISMSQAASFDENLVHISYLPLAHMFEQLIELFIIWYGGRIGFFRGDPRLLIEDIQCLKPNYLPVVPRVLNRLYDKIMDTANQAGFLKRFLFKTALKSKMARLKQGEVTKDTIWDSLVFDKARDSLGGRVQTVITGAAPISAEVLTFMRAALGCSVFQGYGQSECTAGCSVTLVGDQDPGHVGPPMAINRIKLESVPDLNYMSENDEGEVCIKGPNVFRGYLKDDEKTRETLDEEGWLHTGDIGRWNANGTLSIIDRKKNIFKLAQGEYIAPEKIEMVYQQALYVGQAFVYGDSMETYLVGIIVPDEVVAARWATDHNEETTMEAVCKNEQFKKEILKEILELGTVKGLKGFEQVKIIQLCPEAFSVESNLLTPTMKKKRPQLQARFTAEIQAMYAELKA